MVMTGHGKIAFRWLPLILLFLGAGAFFAFGGQNYLSLSRLQESYAALSDYVLAHRLEALLAYAMLYIAAVALSLPGGAVLTVTGGLLFGALFGTITTVIAATLGATILFLAARAAAGQWVQDRTAGWIARMRDGFQRDAFSYLLFLRLVPVFPFFAVNLVPALLNMRLLPYILATLIGIMPGTTVFSLIGAGFGVTLAEGGVLTLQGVLTPELVMGLTGLSLLALLPVILRQLRQRKG